MTHVEREVWRSFTNCHVCYQLPQDKVHENYKHRVSNILYKFRTNSHTLWLTELETHRRSNKPSLVNSALGNIKQVSILNNSISKISSNIIIKAMSSFRPAYQLQYTALKISMNIHFLFWYVDYLSANLNELNEECNERFHQDMWNGAPVPGILEYNNDGWLLLDVGTWGFTRSTQEDNLVFWTSRRKTRNRNDVTIFY